MVSAKWHPNPSAQRQPSTYPSAQRQSLAGPLWEVTLCIFSPQFLHGGALVTNCPSLPNRSTENCCHMGILEGSSSS